MTTAKTNLLMLNPFIATKPFIKTFISLYLFSFEMYIDTAKKVLLLEVDNKNNVQNIIFSTHICCCCFFVVSIQLPLSSLLVYELTLSLVFPLCILVLHR